MVNALLCLFILAAGIGQAMADTAYVSDQCKFTMRRGQGNKYAILQMLRSGQPLQVLQSNQDNGYSLVQTSQGKQGWILTRYLMAQPSARSQLAEMQTKLSTLQQQNSQLQKQVNQLAPANQQLQSNLQQTKQLLQETQTAASHPLKLVEQNKHLSNELQVVADSNMRLTQERDITESSLRWLFSGGLILIVGFIIGMVIPKLKRQKRTQWEG